jgi:hypothetical protein
MTEPKKKVPLPAAREIHAQAIVDLGGAADALRDALSAEPAWAAQNPGIAYLIRATIREIANVWESHSDLQRSERTAEQAQEIERTDVAASVARVLNEHPKRTLVQLALIEALQGTPGFEESTTTVCKRVKAAIPEAPAHVVVNVGGKTWRLSRASRSTAVLGARKGLPIFYSLEKHDHGGA